MDSWINFGVGAILVFAGAFVLVYILERGFKKDDKKDKWKKGKW